jgi:transcription initiation factor TFIID TATA-box-binding protein
MAIDIESSVKIRNITGTFRFKPPIDLDAIYSKYDEKLRSKWAAAIYCYGGIVLWVYRPKITFLVYRNGNVICVGGKNIQDVRDSPTLLVKLLRRAGVRVTKLSQNVKICNIVATFETEKTIDLERISMSRELRVIYEPEQFPGCIVNILTEKGSKATFLLFQSGKAVCVGLTALDEIYEAIKVLYSKIDFQL